MKKSSIIISLTLVLTMIISYFTGWSICSVSAAENETKVYFEVPTLESLGTTKSVYCHIYNVYGGTPLKNTSFQSKEELCKKDAKTGLYYFDTARLGTIEADADYALVFSTVDTEKNSHQTCSITFGKNCLGDTVYVTGKMIENAEDSSKLDYEVAWKNNSDKFGAMVLITSTGKIVGKYFPIYQPREQIVSQFLASWAVLNADIITPEKVEDICFEFGVNPADVLEQYKTDYAEQLADPENNPLIAPVETVAKLLDVEPYPINSIFVIAGNAKLCGINWEGDPTKSPGNVMTDNGDGTYTKVYTDVAVMDGYQFKVVENSTNGQTWYGIDGGDNSFTFNVVSACDVTIMLDSATHKITLVGEGVELVSGPNIESMRTVGNGGGNWLNGIAWDSSADKNLMKEVSSGVYEITYTDIEALGNYKFKFAANGSWNDSWGGAYAGSGVESDAVYNGENITFSVPYELADVTIRLDLTNFEFATKTGAKFTVTVVNKAKSDFTYTVSDDNKVTITGYTGTATAVGIPAAIEGKTVTTIGQRAFWNQTKITSVTIPNSVQTIGNNAFNNCYKLTSVTIPDSVKTIGNNAFVQCRGLTSITIPNGVISIGAGAFGNCTGLTSIAIPSSVTYIGSNPFYNCSKLASIKVDDSNTSYSSVDGVLFNKEQTVLAVYPCGKPDTSYTITDSVTSIKDRAFNDCSNLTSVEIPDSVISIEDMAFDSCGNLTSVEIPGSVTSIGTAAFHNCHGLESIFLPNDLYVANAEIPNTTSQVKYSLDETAGEVTITEIALGIDKTGVAIPATICGYPVVAISDESLLTKISSHTCVGGQATCQNKAICRICKQEYGEKNSNNHTGKLVWATTETQHKKYWNCCNAVVVDYESHTWNNGVCSVCDYTCTHKDTDKNHVCDYCDANVGTHADINKDHKCDYGCSEAIGAHEDTNRDHNCDYCHEQITTCTDENPKDHICDTCGLTLSDHTGGTATCVAKAICEYCTKEYGELDSSNHNLENIPAKDATVTETGYKEYWHCKDCAKYFADEKGTNEIKLDDTVIAKLPPEIIEGKGQSIAEGEVKELTFRSNASFSDFIRVELDGKTLDAENYTATEGSTIITLKTDYVASLSAGEHTIGIVSENGTATTTFTVNAKTVVDNDTKSPQTGDNSHMALWIALLFVSGAGVIGTTVYGKKKRAK